MAIDDNTSYELTGAQVKDLANKIKAKAADNIFVGATSAAPGSKGLVPQPQAGDEGKVLSGAGTWVNQPTVPTVNDATLTITQNGTSAGTFTANASSNATIALTDTTYSDFTGATSSTAGAHGLVPAPAAGDEGKALHGDGTWKDTTAKLVEMSYGESNAWAKFIAAYNAGSIVYCRASSNANPGTGSQTRKAFMAYVNNAASPTNVEFQYVRSQSSKTDSQQTDQVFVYTLTNASGGTWSVASRNMGPKIVAGTGMTSTFTTGANATITLNASAMTGATSGAAGTAGTVPAPAAGDEGKFLKGDGTWATAGGGTSIPTIYLSDDDVMISGSIFGNMSFPNGGFVFCSTPITGGNIPMSESDMMTLLASGCPIRIEGSIMQDGYSTGYGLITCYNDNMGQTIRLRVEYMGTNQLFLGTATIQGTDPNNDGIRWGWMQG